MSTNSMERDILPAREAPHLRTPERCPNCGCEGTLHREERDELVQVGNNVAIVHVSADVCSNCGERIYDLRTVGELQEVERRLRDADTSGLRPVGTVYRAG